MERLALTVTVVGSYPRPPREGGEFKLRKALQALDRGEATPEDVRALQDDLVREVIAEQTAAGVEVVTDGQVRWHDPVARVAQDLEGCTVSGLERYFDTNFYFRRPVVKGPVGRARPIVVDEFRFAQSVSPVPVKAVLIGPYTLAVLSKDEHYRDLGALVRDLAAALREEAGDLERAGARYIQFDEPALARDPFGRPVDLGPLESVAAALVEGLEVTTVLATYFGAVAALGPAFFSLPFDVFALDFVSGPANWEAVHEFPDDRELQAGIVDARNTRLEPVEDLVGAVKEIAEAVAPDRLWLAPSAGLEFLPRESAERKLRLLAEVKGRLA